MVCIKDFLESMRVWPVPDIMQEGSAEHDKAIAVVP